MIFDELNKSKSSIMNVWPVVMKAVSLPLSIHNDLQYMFMSLMIIYIKKASYIDNSLILVIAEMKYLSTHAIHIYNTVIKEIYSFKYCLYSREV